MCLSRYRGCSFFEGKFWVSPGAAAAGKSCFQFPGKKVCTAAHSFGVSHSRKAADSSSSPQQMAAVNRKALSGCTRFPRPAGSRSRAADRAMACRPSSTSAARDKNPGISWAQTNDYGVCYVE